MTVAEGLAEVLGMSWSPQRNIALRMALDLDVAMINRSGVLIAVCPNRREADRVKRLLDQHIATSRYRRQDGPWLITGEVCAP